MQAAATAPITISSAPEIHRAGVPTFRSFQGEGLVVHTPSLAPAVPVGSKDSPAFTEQMAKLDAMRVLEDGWNGYAAPRPLERAIELARSFVQTTWQQGYPPRRLVPSAAGGVAASRRAGRRHVLVEFFNDGRVFALFSDDDTDPDSREVRPRRGDFIGLIQRMKAYLDE